MSTGIVQNDATPQHQQQQDPYFKGSLASTTFYGLLQIVLLIAAIVATTQVDNSFIVILIPAVYIIFMMFQCCVVSQAPIYGLIRNRVHYNAIIPQMRQALPSVIVRLSNEHQNIDVQTKTTVSQTVDTTQTSGSSSVVQSTKSTNSAQVHTKVQNRIVSNNVAMHAANISPFQDCTAPIVHDFNSSNLLLCTHQLITEYSAKNREQIHQQKKFLFNEYHYLDHFAVCTEQIEFPQFSPVFIIHNGQQELKWYQKKSSALLLSLVGLSCVPMHKLFKSTPSTTFSCAR
ncbi:Hypothetical_protein [Hexamita inflata]|uniref:Hypothetical_protein n=1 Tax=Hexamita inflata TaxID=28002 RepID=A0AA86TN45_9EUKA|nr:Hypothetical protein HINF_LOCUS9990 [Hexamita inflata]